MLISILFALTGSVHAGLAEVVPFPTAKVRPVCEALIVPGRTAKTLKFGELIPPFLPIDEFLDGGTDALMFSDSEPPPFTRKNRGTWLKDAFIPRGDRLYILRVSRCEKLPAVASIVGVRRDCLIKEYSFLKVHRTIRILHRILENVRTNEMAIQRIDLGSVWMDAGVLLSRASTVATMNDLVSSWVTVSDQEHAVKISFLEALHRYWHLELDLQGEELIDRLVESVRLHYRSSWHSDDPIDPRHDRHF